MKSNVGRTILMLTLPLLLGAVVFGIGALGVCNALTFGERHPRFYGQLRLLETAVDSYRLNHGKYPPNLEVLLDPDTMNDGVAYLKEVKAIIDPWGEVVRYDPAGPKNRGEKPDIWAEKGEAIIGNWPAER